jgi:hypothetical protein
MKFAVSVPVSALNLPSSGTAIEVTQVPDYRAADDQGPEFNIEVTGSDETVIAMERVVASESAATSLSRSYDEFGVSLPDEYDDVGSAHCVATDNCPRVYRFEPLVVAGGSGETMVSPGGNVSVTGRNSGSHRIWHVVSLRRNRELSGWESNTCADGWRPVMSFAYARE